MQMISESHISLMLFSSQDASVDNQSKYIIPFCIYAHSESSSFYLFLFFYTILYHVLSELVTCFVGCIYVKCLEG